MSSEVSNVYTVFVVNLLLHDYLFFMFTCISHNSVLDSFVLNGHSATDTVESKVCQKVLNLDSEVEQNTANKFDNTRDV